jgi:hypothetical protein
MKTVTIKVCPTVEATRDQEILRDQAVEAIILPHQTAPLFYVGDNHLSELVVREDQELKAREILGLPPE